MQRNAVLVLGITLALAGFMGMLAPHALAPSGATEETANALWLGGLAFGVILMCVAPLLEPKRLYRAPRRWIRFDTGVKPAAKREFGRKSRKPITFRDAPGSLQKLADGAPPLALPPPK